MATKFSRDECTAAGEAAKEVVRKFFVQLCNAVTTGNVVDRLYANNLIDHVAFERYVEVTGHTTTEKVRCIVLTVQRKVSHGFDKNTGKSVISKLCKALRDEPEDSSELTTLANDIEDSFKQEYELQRAIIRAQMAEREELENLRIQLEAFKLTQQISDIPDITNIIKQITLNYIEKSLNATMDVVAIKRQLDEVYNDSLISLELYEWALTEVNNKNGANPDSKPSAYPFINVEPVTDQLLGDSTNGRVHLVVDKKGNKFAAKRFLRAHCKEFTSEFKLLALLRHKNIVQYVGLAQLHPNENPAVVMELMKEDLHKRIMCQSPIVVSKKMHILQDVAEGLYYLHSYKPVIIHRDLTAKNVLLNSTGVAKISDFGNSRMVDQEQLSMMTSLAGTLVYLAPEAQGSEYDEKIDIFSYGHMMLFVFVEEFPNELLSPSYYEVDPRSRTQILKVRPETDRREKYIIKLIDTFVIDLVKKCLSNKPEDRPTAFQLLNHFKSCRDRDNSV